MFWVVTMWCILAQLARTQRDTTIKLQLTGGDSPATLPDPVTGPDIMDREGVYPVTGPDIIDSTTNPPTSDLNQLPILGQPIITRLYLSTSSQESSCFNPNPPRVSPQKDSSSSIIRSNSIVSMNPSNSPEAPSVSLNQSNFEGPLKESINIVNNTEGVDSAPENEGVTRPEAAV